MDTDSFLLHFTDVDILNEINKGELGENMDCSNFDITHKSYDNSKAGVLGLLKSETGSNAIKESITLQPKAYSILLNDDSTKSAAKGINRANHRLLTHQIYDSIHTSVISEKIVKCGNIISKRNKLQTIITNKRALCKLDKKRYWSDENESLAFGHPDIPLILGCENQLMCKKRNQSQLTEDVELNFNVKKLRGINPFFFRK